MVCCILEWMLVSAQVVAPSKLIYDYERREVFCAVCGSIVTQNIVDLRQEWRAFDAS